MAPRMDSPPAQHDVRPPRVADAVFDDRPRPSRAPTRRRAFQGTLSAAHASATVERASAPGPALVAQCGGEGKLGVDVERGFRPRRRADVPRIVRGVVATHGAELERQPAPALRTGCARPAARRQMGERGDVARRAVHDDPDETRLVRAVAFEGGHA